VTTTHRRLRSASVTLSLTALVAAGLTGCAPGAPAGSGTSTAVADNQAICVDPETDKRVDDDLCEDDADHGGSHGGLYAWYFLSRGATVPAIGSRYSGGTFDDSRLRGSTVRGGAPRAGGATVGDATDTGSDSRASTTVRRGGFGGSGHVGS
jgi:hypothetical protein